MVDRGPFFFFFFLASAHRPTTDRDTTFFGIDPKGKWGETTLLCPAKLPNSERGSTKWNKDVARAHTNIVG